MKLALIGLAVVAALFFLNECSCDHWFNNGSCEWSETWLGGAFK